MADVELALMLLLDDFGYTTTTTPSNLDDVLPVLRVRRVGGSADADNDRPRMSVQVFARTVADTSPRAHMMLASEVDNFLFKEIPGASVPLGDERVVFDAIARDSGPVELVYPNTSVRVAELLYSLTTRR